MTSQQHAQDSQAPGAQRRASVYALGAYALFAALFLGAGWSPDARLWGVHHLAFLSPARWFAAAGFCAALAVPAIAGALGNGIAAIGVRVVASIWAPWAVAVVVLAFGALNAIDFPFLGDGIAWSNGLRAGTFFYYFEPLAIAASRAVAGIAATSDAARGAAVLPILLGPVYVYGTARLCRAVFDEAWARGTGWALLILNPVLLFYCGYLESYPLLVVVQVFYAWASVQSARGRCAFWVPTLLGSVAAATHVSAVSWLPVLLVVAHERSQQASSSEGAVSPRTRGVVRGALAMFGALIVAAGLVRAVGVHPGRLLEAIAGHTGLGGHSWTWLFSARHAVDVANQLLLLLAPAFVVLAAGLAHAAPLRRAWRPGGLPAVWRVVLALLVGPLVIALGIEPRIGGARDWDLFTPLLLPAVLLCVRAARHLREPARTGIAGRAVGLALVTTLAWFAVGVSAERSARRLEVLQQPHALITNYARGYANETLGIYYRDHDPAAARDAWQRATEANANNPRYFNNLGNEEIRLGNQAAACAAFQRTLELGLDEYFVLYNVAGCARVEERFAVAESLLTVLVQRAPERAEAWSDRGFVRLRVQRPHDAMADLQTALELAPRDPENWYRIGLAHMELGDMQRASAAWQRTLQLDPRHPRALRRLRGSGSQ